MVTKTSSRRRRGERRGEVFFVVSFFRIQLKPNQNPGLLLTEGGDDTPQQQDSSLEDGKILDSSFTTIGHFLGDKILDGSFTTIGYIWGDKILDGSFTTIGYFSGDKLLDGSFTTIGYFSGLNGDQVLNGRFSTVGYMTGGSLLHKLAVCYFFQFKNKMTP
jgi:hypothetical protein